MLTELLPIFRAGEAATVARLNRPVRHSAHLLQVAADLHACQARSIALHLRINTAPPACHLQFGGEGSHNKANRKTRLQPQARAPPH